MPSLQQVQDSLETTRLAHCSPFSCSRRISKRPTAKLRRGGGRKSGDLAAEARRETERTSECVCVCLGHRPFASACISKWLNVERSATKTRANLSRRKRPSGSPKLFIGGSWFIAGNISRPLYRAQELAALLLTRVYPFVPVSNSPPTSAANERLRPSVQRLYSNFSFVNFDCQALEKNPVKRILTITS